MSENAYDRSFPKTEKSLDISSKKSHNGSISISLLIYTASSNFLKT